MQGAPPCRADDIALEFTTRYVESYPGLVRLCRRYVRNAADAEDLAQEAFLQAWAARTSYIQSRPFWPWVTTIARRLGVDEWRHQQIAAVHAETILRLYGPMKQPSSSDEHDARFERVENALSSLSIVERRIIRRYADDWTYREIAAADGVTVESVRARLRRSRRALRSAHAGGMTTTANPAIDERPTVAFTRLKDVGHHER
jgi:RNA polymerase sigma-70 factor (ECF subfamily)